MAGVATSSPPPESTQFGKYLLLERLGRGGMAEVWKARITGPAGFERTMVVKRILPQLVEDPDFVEMFVSEARLSARLNHANIVTVFELGMCEGEYYLAMEYVRGRDLMSVLRLHAPRGPLPIGFAAYTLREVARALGYAHSLTDDDGHALRIIHRDVSPSNVMIGLDGSVKLLDFGIAKALSESQDIRTQTGTLKGKFGYMSPEQVEAREIDHRSDLFSVGILLHECLTGRRLFRGVHDMQTLEFVRAAKVDPPSLFNTEVPQELDELCLKVLARDPNDRVRDGEELAAALDRYVHLYDWGPERMAAFMRSLFPAAQPGTSSASAPHIPSDVRSSASRRRRRKVQKRLQQAGMAAALLFAGGFGVWRWTRQPALVVAAPIAPAQPIAAPAPPRRKVIVVDSTPHGAEVFVDGSSASRGRTPLELVVIEGESHKVVLKHDGFQPAERELQSTEPRAVVELSKLAPPPPSAPVAEVAKGRPVFRKEAPPPLKMKPGTPPPPIAAKPATVVPVVAKPAEPPAAKPSGPKKPEDVIKGDFVDPFSEK